MDEVAWHKEEVRPLAYVIHKEPPSQNPFSPEGHPMVSAYVAIYGRLAHLRGHEEGAVVQLRQYVEIARLRINPFS